jgi:DNA-directed RNA polymerase I, II, and III subunit RPABC2
MPYLTKFERIRVLGARATQISQGAPSTVDITGLTEAIEIAKKELSENKLPIIIQRIYPCGKIVEISVMEMQEEEE